MRWPSTLRRGLLLVWAAVLCAWQLTGCGGGLVAGGVGSGGSGVAEGSVTGFGSVIVDGVAYGDSNANVERLGESGASEAKLGQRVRVEYDSSSRATRILILPQLIGQANGVPNEEGDFMLLGQRVRIVDANSADYPATVFEGLTQVSSGDVLEVHGSWSRESNGRPLLIASRIEKRSVLPEQVLMTAYVLERKGQTILLDDAAYTPITSDKLPDSVQPGALVSLWLPRATVRVAASPANPWVATRAQLASATPDSATVLHLNAVVSDSQQGYIRVQGLWVKLPDDWHDAAPRNGTPVQIQVERNGGGLQARSVKTQVAAAVSPIEIKGSLRWSTNANNFQLRNTSVQLPSNLLAGSCAGLQEGEEIYISLKAQRRNPGLPPEATEMECSRKIPPASVQEANGVVLAMDPDRRTLDMRIGNEVLTLTWTQGQALMPEMDQWRIGMGGAIEYQRGSDGLMLRKLKRKISTPSQPQ